jgi:thiamine-phosphate pyrophosphorylase
MSGAGAARDTFDAAPLRLIAITDSLREGMDAAASHAAAAVAGGATMLQLRLKDESPRLLVEVARALRSAAPSVPLVVIGRTDVALASGASGVHVTADDVAPSALRRVVPPGFIIGASVSDADQAARAAGADYVAIGPVFARGSSTFGGRAIGAERFAELARRCALPAVAIGGITPANVAEVMAAGASGVAVFSALYGAADPRLAARALRDALDASGR